MPADIAVCAAGMRHYKRPPSPDQDANDHSSCASRETESSDVALPSSVNSSVPTPPPSERASSECESEEEETLDQSDEAWTAQKEIWARERHEASKLVLLVARRQYQPSDEDEGTCECGISEDEGLVSEDPVRLKAAEFWRWSPLKQGWYHFDKETNEIIWAPDEFD